MEKKILTALIVILAALFSALPVWTSETDPSPLKERMQEIRSRLALTEKQQEQVRPILKNHFEAQAAILQEFDIRGEKQPNFQDIRKLRMALNDNKASTAKRLSDILSKQQLAEFDKVQTERETRIREKILSKHIDAIGVKLELTKEQKARITPVLEAHIEAQAAILEKFDLGGGKHLNSQEIRELRTAFNENKAGTAKRLSKILSKKQRAEFDKMQTEQETRIRKEILFKRIDAIGAKLELTEGQMAQVRPVLEEYFEAQAAVLDKHDIDIGNQGKQPRFGRIRRLRKMRALSKDLDKNTSKTVEQLSGILSESQLSEYKKMQAEQRKQMRDLIQSGS